MDKENRYGQKLTDAEYESAVVDLHSAQPAMPTKDEDRLIRKQELFLAIDHRLGRDFPNEKREELWQVQERIEKKRLRLAIRHGLKSLLFKSHEPKTGKLVDFMVSEYAKVIGSEDARKFFKIDVKGNNL